MKSRAELKLHITNDVRTLDRYQLSLEEGITAEIFGDPDNACYEWRLVHANGLVEQHSDCGYETPGAAMRDALVIFYGPPRSGGEIVDLRPDDYEPRHWEDLKVKAPSITADLIELADKELEALRQDAKRYRLLREHWVRIEDEPTVRRSGGLDRWCDKRLIDAD